MSQYVKTFERNEKKYLMTGDICREFCRRIASYMQEDEYGLHTICNIYFDTAQYDMIRTSLEKPAYKEKLRLRSYGVPKKDSTVFVEIKKKVQGIVYKRREGMNCRQAVNYLEHGIAPEKETQIQKEIDYLMKFYRPEPKLFLAYDRRAFFGLEDGELRLTLDTNIRSRQNRLDLTAGGEGERLFDQDMYLLEIKVGGAFPLWLSKILSELSIFPVSFSKYGAVFQKSILKQELLREHELRTVTDHEWEKLRKEA